MSGVNSEIINKCYEDLACAVIISAVDDLAKALCSADEVSTNKIISWLCSDSAKVFMLGANPLEIIEKLIAELKRCDYNFKLYKDKFSHYRIR